MIFAWILLGFLYSWFSLSAFHNNIDDMASGTADAANNMSYDVAAPVPIPEVDYEEDDSFHVFDRSEGWRPRRASGNGDANHDQDFSGPVKTGESGRPSGKPFSFYRKRAFKRAVARAKKHGTTQYRGQTCDVQDLMEQYQTSAAQQNGHAPRRKLEGSAASSHFSLSLLGIAQGSAPYRTNCSPGLKRTRTTSFSCKKLGTGSRWILTRGATIALAPASARRLSEPMQAS